MTRAIYIRVSTDDYLMGGLAVIERGVRGCRAGMVHPLKTIVSESEAPQASAVLTRWVKTSVPAKAQTRQDPLTYC